MQPIARAAALLTWQVVASCLFLLLGGVVIGLPVWTIGRLEAMQLGVLYLAYLASTAAPSAFFVAGQAIRPWIIAALGAIAFLVAWPVTVLVEQGLLQILPFVDGHKDLGLLEWHMPASLPLALGLLAILLNLALLRSTGSALRLLSRNVTTAALVALLCLLSAGSHRVYRGLDRPQTLDLGSSLHAVRLEYFHERVPPPAVPGGALQAVGERMLLATGDGRLYVLDWLDDARRLAVEALPYRVPMNAAEFGRDNPGLSAWARARFRTLDLLVTRENAGEHGQLLVSHHFWDSARACHVIRISAFASAVSALVAATPREQWRTLYQTSDCLPVALGREAFFAGHQAGGQMAQANAHHILLALGDQGFDGVQTAEAVSQDTNSEHGKVLEIDLRNGSARHFSSGHRSPGGLLVDGHGRIWLAEHGPKGGDELNLLRDGGNYGWPVQSLGARYGGFEWLGPAAGAREAQFESPVFAWTPSIGTSALVSVAGAEFHRWSGDLVVAGLAARALFRVHLQEGRPVLAEPIPVYARVRDILQDERGRLVLWTDEADIILLRAGSEPEP